MITYSSKGDFSKTFNFFEHALKAIRRMNLDKYGEKGVKALSENTPFESGKTAESWYYEVEKTPYRSTITYYNSNVNDRVNIAIILQYGHATRNGGWVEGVDYINPSIRPLFDKLADDAWKEVTGL